MVLLLTGCSHRAPLLRCRSDYLDPNYLASEWAETPDPLRFCFYGQQIVVFWNLPHSCLGAPVELQVQIRDGAREIETLLIPINQSKGSWVYRLVNDAYWQRGGILSFKAELIQNGELLGEWKHSLWSDIIEINQI